MASFLVPPVIIDKETSKVITVDEGDNVRMSCAAAGKPTPEIVWRREVNNPMTTGSWESKKLVLLYFLINKPVN